MRFSICVTVALATIADAWVVPIRNTVVNSRTITKTTKTTTTSRTNIYGTQLFSTKEKNDTEEDVVKTAASASRLGPKDVDLAISLPTSSKTVELEPHYQAAYDVAIKKLTAVFPKDKIALLEPLKYFINEYLGASQTACASGECEVAHHPEACVARILNAISLATKLGLKDSPSYFTFDVSHRALRGVDPEKENGNDYDFYKFGCDFFRPYMDMRNSKVMGLENIKKINKQLEAGENVVFLANHQSEADPQVVSVCLESIGEDVLAEKITYVAGHKVTTDPLAIPFSMGRNLICIHSKKHIDADKTTKGTKQRQNLRAMSSMLNLLKQGGAALWVAPSGGRDRRNVETREVPPAVFDSKTIDMFRLMGQKSKVKTHYYPMAIVSYDLCPPPDYTVAGVGEERNVRFVPVGVSIGEEIPNEGGLDKRHEFCEAAFNSCVKDYTELKKEMGVL